MRKKRKIGWDRDEVGRARTLTLRGASPVVVGIPSWPIEVSIGFSVCAELIAKRAKSRDPSQGTLLLRPKGTSSERAILFIYQMTWLIKRRKKLPKWVNFSSLMKNSMKITKQANFQMKSLTKRAKTQEKFSFERANNEKRVILKGIPGWVSLKFFLTKLFVR